MGAAMRRAFENTPAFQLRGHAQHGKHKLGKVSRGIEHGFCERTEARAGALHIAGDHEQVGRVAREPINRRGYHHVAGRESGH